MGSGSLIQSVKVLMCSGCKVSGSPLEYAAFMQLGTTTAGHVLFTGMAAKSTYKAVTDPTPANVGTAVLKVGATVAGQAGMHTASNLVESAYYSSSPYLK